MVIFTNNNTAGIIIFWYLNKAFPLFIFLKTKSNISEKIMVIIPIERISLTPSFFANNNPPPIVIMHAGHIVYDKIK